MFTEHVSSVYYKHHIKHRTFFLTMQFLLMFDQFLMISLFSTTNMTSHWREQWGTGWGRQRHPGIWGTHSRSVFILLERFQEPLFQSLNDVPV